VELRYGSWWCPTDGATRLGVCVWTRQPCTPPGGSRACRHCFCTPRYPNEATSPMSIREVSHRRGSGGPGGGGFNLANDRVAAALQVHHNLGFAAFPRSLLGGSCLLRRGWPHMASTLNPDPGQGSRDHPRCPSWALNHDSDGPRAITGGCCVHHCPLHMPHRPTPIEPHWSTNRAADWLGCYSQSRNVGVTRRQSMERWQH